MSQIVYFGFQCSVFCSTECKQTLSPCNTRSNVLQAFALETKEKPLFITHLGTHLLCLAPGGDLPVGVTARDSNTPHAMSQSVLNVR